MTTLLPAIVLGSVVLLVGAVLYTRTRLLGGPPVCPSCAAAFIPLPQGDRPAYDVLVCPQCANTMTAVHGGPSRFAACSECNQRTLEVNARRLPPTPEAPIAVECFEHCHVCNHQDRRILPDQPLEPRRGVVIPFPQR